MKLTQRLASVHHTEFIFIFCFQKQWHAEWVNYAARMIFELYTNLYEHIYTIHRLYTKGQCLFVTTRARTAHQHLFVSEKALKRDIHRYCNMLYRPILTFLYWQSPIMSFALPRQGVSISRRDVICHALVSPIGGGRSVKVGKNGALGAVPSVGFRGKAPGMV